MNDYYSWASKRIDEIFNQPKEDILELLNDIDFFRDKTGEMPIYDESENKIVLLEIKYSLIIELKDIKVSLETEHKNKVDEVPVYNEIFKKFDFQKINNNLKDDYYNFIFDEVA